MRRRSCVLALAALAGCGSPGGRADTTTPRYTAAVSFQIADPVAVRIVAVDAETGDAVYDRRHDFDRADRLEISEAFDRGRDYEVRVLIDGDVRFERLIHDYEEYVLRIADGEVAVESYVEK